MAVTLKDIAKKANVSVSTVSSVANGKYDVIGVAGPTRKRIQEIIHEMGYVPNTSARSLRLNKSNTIGVIVSHMEEYIYGRITAAIENELSGHEYHCLFSAVEDKVDPGVFYSGLLSGNRVDGIITVGFFDDIFMKKLLLNASKYKLKVIQVSMGVGDETSYVDIDNEYGAYTATKHLIGLGHERIAYLGQPQPKRHSVEREKGYTRALFDAGIEPIVIDVGLSLLDPYDPLFGYYVMKEYITQAEVIPSAVICYNDTSAFGVIKAAKEAGFNVPKHISVVGFDNILWSIFSEPPMTTVAAPWEEVGQNAARLMLKLIQGKNEITTEGILVRPRLLKRGSSAPL